MIDVKEKITLEYKRLCQKNTFQRTIATVTQSMAMAMALLLTGYLVIKKKTPIGAFVLVYNTGRNLQSAVSSFVGTISTWDQFGINFADWNRLMNLEEEPEGDEDCIDKIHEIEMKNVEFRYPQRSESAVKNINLRILTGEKIAIVGENGSGKTTLANILMGFYDDYEGEIFINGLNLKTLDKESYRERLGALFQDFGKYEASIRENIAYGNLDLLHADSYIMEIAREFDILSLIERAPNNLETQLGYWFDEGKQISIGQWQKVALCRAFIKNADVYILDEPNAALDAISEYYIAQLYKKILYEKLGIIIAHKFGNFVQNIDRIFVLEDGEIVQQGSHTQLLSEGGIYKYLYELQ